MEEIDLILEDTKERMDKSIQFLITELKKLELEKLHQVCLMELW